MTTPARSTARRSKWLKRMQPRPQAALRLIALAHAGGGASTFRGWSAALPEDIEVVAVQLPGREERLSEAALSSIAPLVTALADELVLERDSPFALFGYSMGALIAFELCRELRRRRAPMPVSLFAAAHRAPQVSMPVLGLHELSDEDFIAEVNRRYDAVPAAVLADQGLMELLLPPLRADMSVCDSYVYAAEDPFDVPISAFGGADDHNVSRAELDAWAEQTTGAFASTVLPGDHFFMSTASQPLLAEVTRTLQESDA
ncbi:MAG: medium-chain acyl-[acyl-carrier-protein] hydrolase [Pseudohongiellaceae bacterium]|jgi:medium-chain acyl-[acyl-carrier-protein] hydrolase